MECGTGCATRVETTEVVVVGAGAAGCFAAIKASEVAGSVLLVSKCPVGRGGATEVAESFMQAPFGHEDPRDNPEIHFQDTIKGGYGLADRSLARALAADACDRIRDLQEYGLRFGLAGDNRFKQWIAAGYTYARACSPEQGGHGIMATLHNEVRRRSSIQIEEDLQVVRCLQSSDGSVCGVAAIDRRTGGRVLIRAKAVVLATGGNGAVWDQSDVPPDETGDGMAMAYHVGCDLIDMEMVLYYPTVIVAPAAIRGTEIPGEMILRRAGAKLLNSLGQDFVPEEIPVRDKLSRLIFTEIAEGRGTANGGVILDLTKSPYGSAKVRDIVLASLRAKYLYIKNKGIDIVEQPVEVAPMVHFTIGGIRIDEHGNTSVRGLFAGGEVAANCHGANRLAGNALTDAIVFGARAGKTAATYASHVPLKEPLEEQVRTIFSEIDAPFSGKGGLRSSQVKKNLRETMSQFLGPIRTEDGILEARLRLAGIRESLHSVKTFPNRRWNLEWLDYLDLLAMIDVAEAVAGSALLRRESRGHHWRKDYPVENDREWLKHTCVKKGPDGMVFGVLPIDGLAV